MHKLKMVFAAGIFATLPLSAAPFAAYIHKADGDTQIVRFELKEGSEYYFEVSLKDKRLYDYATCVVRDNTVCTMHHGSTMRFERLKDKRKKK